MEKQDTSSKCGKYLTTVALFMSCGCTNLLFGEIGPTLLNLAVYLDVELEYLSLWLMCTGFGYLLGAILCSLVFDKYNRSLLLGISVLCLAVFNMMAPLNGNLWCFVIFITLAFVSSAFVASGNQTQLLEIWAGHRYLNTIFQCFHFAGGVGGFLSPLLVRPFLVEIYSAVSHKTHRSNRTNTHMDTLQNMSHTINKINVLRNKICNISDKSFSSLPADNFTFVNIDDATYNCSVGYIDASSVKHGYILIGCVCLPTALLFVISYCIYKDTQSERHHKQNRSNQAQYSTHQCFMPLFVTALSVFCFSYVISASNPMVAPFIAEGLGWTIQNAALGTSLFMIGFTLSKVLGAIVLVYIEPSTLMSFNFLILIVVCFIYFFAHTIPVEGIWCCLFVHGLFCGNNLTCIFPWTAKHIKISGVVSGTSYIGIGIAFMGTTAAVGFLFVHYTAMSYVFVLLAAVIMLASTFIIMNILVKIYKPQHESINIEMDIADVEVKEKLNG